MSVLQPDDKVMFYEASKDRYCFTVFINNNDKTNEVEYMYKKLQYVYVKFFSNSKPYKYNSKNVTIVKNNNILSDSENIKKMEYFAEGSETIKFKNVEDEEEGDSILKGYFDKINVIPDYSVLGTYLSKQPIAKKTFDTNRLIYPFGINLSQKKAVENTFLSQISIIEGAPGTGKTQVILSIIANLILNNYSVAVVSNNNAAIKNVDDKLAKYNFDFLTAFLGSKDNKEKFISNQVEKYPDLSAWEHHDIRYLEDAIYNNITKIETGLAYQNELAKLIQLKAEYVLEDTYFDKDYDDTHRDIEIEKILSDMPTDKIFKLWFYCTNQKDRKKNSYSFLNKLFFLRILKFKYISLKNKNLFIYVASIQKAYYNSKIKELEDSIDKINSSLINFNMDDILKNLNTDSLKVLQRKMFDRYQGKEHKKVSIKEMSSISTSFIDEYPIIFSTLYSIKNMCNDGSSFDYIIVDEASQADLITSVLGMSCAKNMVIVGDLKQLPNVITSDVIRKGETIWSKYNYDNAYKYFQHSLLSSIAELYPEIPSVLLKEHYRCHPKIINFCSKKFYNDDLIIMTEDIEDKNTLSSIKAVEGNHARGRYNQRHIDIILQEIMPNIDSSASIGIIAPYRDQVTEMRKHFSDNIEIDTIHKFQGREKDIIIFCTVDNNITDFVDNANMINVAVSRAVTNFFLVYSNEKPKSSSNILDLVNYIKYNNFDVISSKVRSIFDLLYKQYAEEKMKYLGKNKAISVYDSENLAYACINEVLHENNISSIDFVHAMPLKNFIKTDEDFTDEELIFIERNSHVDFLFYNTMNKIPYLAVEIDGHEFHKNNSDQLYRDSVKDCILEKAGIKLLRLPSTGSNEKQKLKIAILGIG